MNEQQFANKLRHALNRGLAVDKRVAGRLRAARERALARQRTEPASALAWADHALVLLGGWRGVAARVVLPFAVLLAVVLGGQAWQQNQRLAELVEIDAQLLTDELPIDAYLDRGFQAWLKKRRTDL